MEQLRGWGGEGLAGEGGLLLGLRSRHTAVVLTWWGCEVSLVRLLPWS